MIALLTYKTNKGFILSTEAWWNIFCRAGHVFFVFFLFRVFFHRHWRFTGQQGKGEDHLLFHSTTSTAHEHSDIYLQLCMWDDYHVFLIAKQVFTRLLLDEIHYLIELPIDWLIDDAKLVCLIDKMILGFCYSDFEMRNRWIWTCIDYQPCSTSELTKCASHSKSISVPSA